ncbi:hypothetical protein ACJ41P_10390 [Azospirillum argentinense]|uniref:Uncharacterized protein n=1 Tax=Azospirillum argentinense TaxID=2970906 RepID=A0ABW8V5E6_9PROT
MKDAITELSVETFVLRMLVAECLISCAMQQSDPDGYLVEMQGRFSEKLGMLRERLPAEQMSDTGDAVISLTSDIIQSAREHVAQRTQAG